MNATRNVGPVACCACIIVASGAQTPAWNQLPMAPPVTTVTWDTARGQLLLVDANLAFWQWSGGEASERFVPGMGSVQSRSRMSIDHLLQDPAAGRVLAVATDTATQTGHWVGAWQGGAWGWTTGGNVPPYSQPVAVAWDSRRGRLVSFGSTTAGSALYEWDGRQWWRMTPPTGPSPRTGAALAFDPDLGCCVLYGGDAGAGPLADTWAWDGFAWTQLHSAAPPGPRHWASLAHDPHHRRLILQGGDAASTATWQLLAGSWIQLPTIGDPGLQQRAQMFPDDRGLMLVSYGGWQAGIGRNPARAVWRLQRQPAGDVWSEVVRFPLPTPRNNLAFAFDPVRRQFVGFGGTAEQFSQGPIPDLTAVFDRRWRWVAPSTVPAARHSTQLAWSQASQRVLMFGGGATGNSVLGDTWTWDGGNWHAHSTGPMPSPRIGFVLTEDPNGDVLLFGGSDHTARFGDTWLWNSAGWRRATTPVAPTPRQFAVAGFDPIRRQVILFGGFDPAAVSDTWAWDGAAWQLQRTSPMPLHAGSGGTMALRPATGRLLMLGLTSVEWTGTDWVAVSGLSTSVSWLRMVSDPVSGRLLAVWPPNVYQLTDRAPDAQPYGTGCASGPAPTLAVLDRPVIDTQFSLEVGGGPSSAPAFLVVGVGEVATPLAGGCTVWVSQQLTTLSRPTVGGVARFAFQVPHVPTLVGMRFHAQGALVDPAGSTMGNVTLTHGLRVMLGD